MRTTLAPAAQNGHGQASERSELRRRNLGKERLERSTARHVRICTALRSFRLVTPAVEAEARAGIAWKAKVQAREEQEADSLPEAERARRPAERRLRVFP